MKLSEQSFGPPHAAAELVGFQVELRLSPPVENSLEAPERLDHGNIGLSVTKVTGAMFHVL